MRKQQSSAALEDIAREVRKTTLRTISSDGVGHVGGCMSVVELFTVLYFKQMRIDPKRPDKKGRDRLVCSKGHAGPTLYAILAMKGYFDPVHLETLNQPHTILPSHCDMNKTPGIDMTAGSLGQGFSCAVGQALGSKIAGDGARIYTVIGDGESQKGQIWEAAMFAGNHGLDNLTAFLDLNRCQVDGWTSEINDVEPAAEKWRAFKWNVVDVPDGNDVHEIDCAIVRAKRCKGRPTMVVLHTVKGRGVGFVEKLGPACHHINFGKGDLEAAIREIDGGGEQSLDKNFENI